MMKMMTKNIRVITWSEISYIKVFIAAIMALTTFVASAATATTNVCVDGAKPMLSVADFSGDGIVDNADLVLIGKVLKVGRYVAYFDRNADGMLDLKDLDLSNQDLGKNSNTLDREIAEVFWATEKYRALGKGALAGYVPLTQNLKGHGVHWLQPFIFAASAYPNTPVRANPEGLNYSTDGQIQAVYWGQKALTDENGKIISDPPPVLFSAAYSSDPVMWHHHEQACVTNMGFIDKVKFEQGIHPAQCAQRQGLADGVSASFYMMHMWLYRLNPNGLFATTHPCAGLK